MSLPATSERGGAIQAAIIEDVPDYIQKAIVDLHPEVLSTPADELVPEPSVYLLGIRQNFWKLIRLKKRDPSLQITTESITGNFMTRGAFVSKIKNEPSFLAWLLQPPMEEAEFLDALTELGRRQMLKILTFPLWKIERDKYNEILLDKSTGEPIKKPDISAAKIVAAAFEMLDKRKHGEYTQKILQKGEIAHHHIKDEEKSPPHTLEDINREIARLEHDAKRLAITVDSVPLAPRIGVQAKET
jgi:hypothetical protein